jgi:hypothetical protein
MSSSLGEEHRDVNGDMSVLVQSAALTVAASAVEETKVKFSSNMVFGGRLGTWRSIQEDSGRDKKY